MKTLLWFVIALLAGFGTQAQSRVVQRPPVGDYTTPALLQDRVKTLDKYLAEFARTSSVSVLETALTNVDCRFPRQYFLQFPAERDSLLRRRLRIARHLSEARLSVIDAMGGRTPIYTVSVPARQDKVNGQFYLPGTDPARIADPELRREYEAALHKDRRLIDLDQRKRKLDVLEGHASSGIGFFIMNAYPSVNDRQRLYQILDEEVPDVRRRRVIYESAEVPLPAKDRPAAEDSALPPSAATNSAPAAP